MNPPGAFEEPGLLSTIRRYSLRPRNMAAAPSPRSTAPSTGSDAQDPKVFTKTDLDQIMEQKEANMKALHQAEIKRLEDKIDMLISEQRDPSFRGKSKSNSHKLYHDAEFSSARGRPETPPPPPRMPHRMPPQGFAFEIDSDSEDNASLIKDKNKYKDEDEYEEKDKDKKKKSTRSRYDPSNDPSSSSSSGSDDSDNSDSESDSESDLSGDRNRRRKHKKKHGKFNLEWKYWDCKPDKSQWVRGPDSYKPWRKVIALSLHSVGWKPKKKLTAYDKTRLAKAILMTSDGLAKGLIDNLTEGPRCWNRLRPISINLPNKG
ncbi:uncharacterized protein BCR38DRAFT_414462 [Pseudomassariella vexata]|uniref:Uncharacterized protein n=1 Tax=Pseudomassariella vexata TaxID=1141098 RepID=A0A1Y2DC75_9PEZI|nr:uncharacterized protein BCR38DRAFT_414462 [Pseudomassariella vexata]ORY56716.1 hypothetical protein BCR38DRAFT_414462 [Pseudomassariella vexata]